MDGHSRVVSVLPKTEGSRGWRAHEDGGFTRTTVGVAWETEGEVREVTGLKSGGSDTVRPDTGLDTGPPVRGGCGLVTGAAGHAPRGRWSLGAATTSSGLPDLSTVGSLVGVSATPPTEAPRETDQSPRGHVTLGHRGESRGGT